MGIRRALALIITFMALCMPSWAIKIGLQTRVNRTFVGASTKAEVINCDTNKLILLSNRKKQGLLVLRKNGIEAHLKL